MQTRDTMHREIFGISVRYFQFMLREIYESRSWEWADMFVIERGKYEINTLVNFAFPSSEAFAELRQEHNSLIELLTDVHNIWTLATLYRSDHEERP